MPHKVDTKTTKALYEMGCDDKASTVFLSSKKELCELCIDLVVFVIKTIRGLNKA